MTVTDAEDLVLVGRVARAHGNRGQVIVNPETDFAEERFRAGEVMLVGPDATPRAIRDVRFQQGRPIVTLDGIETMNEADALAGAELKMPARAPETLPAGTYHHYDLVGCDVRDAAGDLVGRVRAVEGTREMSRLVVDGTAAEVLIPLVEEICVSIDITARTIVVDPPEGLLDLNAPSKAPPPDAERRG